MFDMSAIKSADLCYVSIIPCFVAGYVVFICIYNRYFHPLHDFPGPLLAALTSVYQFHALWEKDSLNVQLKLHEKYGVQLHSPSNSREIILMKTDP